MDCSVAGSAPARKRGSDSNAPTRMICMWPASDRSRMPLSVNPAT
jgi:hypothetical protein